MSAVVEQVARSMVVPLSRWLGGWSGAELPDPAPVAPPALAERVGLVLGIVKWGSLMAALAVLLGAGAVLVAGERGHGTGLSPQLKSMLGSVVVVLIVVGTASQLVSFLA